MGESTGAGAIFGTTGGVMEAALRTAYEWITDKEMPTLEYTPVRGFEGIKEAIVDIDGNKLRIAVVHTLKNAALIMDKLRAGKCEYDFIEVMACPGGCIGGAGTIADPARTAVALNKYVKEAPFQDPEQSPFMTSIHVLKDDPNFEV